MALFHFHVTQIKPSTGQSAVACTAYRAGEKLFSEYYGEVSDYTHKGGVVCTDIILPSQAWPGRKFCVKRDKHQSREWEQIKGLPWLGTVGLNRAYPPVFREGRRYARAA